MRIVLYITTCFLLLSCDDFEYNENEVVISKYSDNESHNTGINCMNCHYTAGPGEGYFSIAGSAYQNYSNSDIEVYINKTDSTPILKVPFDQLGNAYTTESVDFSDGLYVAIRSNNNVRKFKKEKVFNGQCNLCHGTNVAEKLYINW